MLGLMPMDDHATPAPGSAAPDSAAAGSAVPGPAGAAAALAGRDYGEVLWEPSAEAISGARVTAYARWLMATRGLDLRTHDQLWQWSVDEPAGFWESVWDYFGVLGDRGPGPVLSGAEMPEVSWFEGATLNYARNALRTARTEPDRTAVIYRSEDGSGGALSYGELEREVIRVAAGLRALGVNTPDTPWWDRAAQLLIGFGLSVIAIRRGRWPAVLLICAAVRVALDPNTYPYYDAGPVVGALVWDLMGGRRAVPAWTLAAGSLYWAWSAAGGDSMLTGDMRVGFAVAVAACTILAPAGLAVIPGQQETWPVSPPARQQPVTHLGLGDNP